MGDENPIRTLGDYSKPSHEGYRNTIELPIGNNVDPNKHLKDFLKLVDSLDLDGENRERMHLRLFQFSLRDQASNWLEHLPAGSITTWEDLTTLFLTQFFPPGRTAKLRNDIMMFQQHHGESLSEAWTRFKDLLQKLRDRNAEESWALLEDLALYDNESWNDPRDFAKPVKAITLPQDVLSTSDCRLIELENQYCMEDPEQAFVEYASSRFDEAGGKWYTFKPEQNNLGDTYNPSWRSHPNLSNNPQSFDNQLDLEGLVYNFMASQDARLSKFEADFKQQQSEMTNKINTVLKAITNQIAGTLPINMVNNSKLSTYPVFSTRSYPTEDPQCSTQTHSSINTITIHTEQQSASYNDGEKENKKEEDNP
ncbi:MAK10-like protein [Tanacetum coccineum]